MRCRKETGTLDPMLAIQLLLACRGDEIWSPETCRAAGLPESWLDELVDTHESGFRFSQQEIRSEGRLVNHYRGVSDLRLAVRLAGFLGIETADWQRQPISPRELVRRIQAELDEL